MKRVLILASVVAVSTGAAGGPLFPSIDGHEFTFDAFNQDGSIEYHTNGVQPDALVYTKNVDHQDFEVITYKPDWPDQPTCIVYDELTGQMPGGDFYLAVGFDGQDAPIGSIDVSLTGSGLNPAGVADLEIYGTVQLPDDPNVVLSGLLWALDIDQASLYGRSAGHESYVLEGLGTILDCLIADHYALVGDAGSLRGHIAFFDQPDGWIPTEYHPEDDMDEAIRAGLSGDTGWLPEPASLILIVAGLPALRRRR